MAKRMAGSILATRSSLPQTRLTPTQKIKIEPISERYETASSVRAGASSWARSVTAPSSTNTGMAEKMQPLPSDTDS